MDQSCRTELPARIPAAKARSRIIRHRRRRSRRRAPASHPVAIHLDSGKGRRCHRGRPVSPPESASRLTLSALYSVLFNPLKPAIHLEPSNRPQSVPSGSLFCHHIPATTGNIFFMIFLEIHNRERRDNVNRGFQWINAIHHSLSLCTNSRKYTERSKRVNVFRPLNSRMTSNSFGLQREQ